MAKRFLSTCSITLVYCFIWQILEKIMYGQVQGRLVDDIIMLLFIPVIWLAVGRVGVRPTILDVQRNADGEVIEVEWTCPVCGLNALQQAPCANYCQCCGSKLIFKGGM